MDRARRRGGRGARARPRGHLPRVPLPPRREPVPARLRRRRLRQTPRQTRARVAETVANLRARTAPDPVLFLAHVDACWSDHCNPREPCDPSSCVSTGRASRGAAREACGTSRCGSSDAASRVKPHRRSRPSGRATRRGTCVRGFEPRRRRTRDASLATRDDAASPQSSVPSDAIAKTVRGVLAVIAKERDGEAIDRARVRRLLRMLVVGIVRGAFRARVFRRLAAHYRAEGDARVVADDASEYLRHCETRLAEEEARAEAYLDPSTLRASRDD